MSFADAMRSADRFARERLGEPDPVTYTPGVGAPVAVRGIFDLAYVEVNAGGQAGVSSQGPAVFLTLADLASDPETDLDATVTIRGVIYKPRDVQKDGLGAVLLLLNEA